jgi:hypothetical protein
MRKNGLYRSDISDGTFQEGIINKKDGTIRNDNLTNTLVAALGANGNRVCDENYMRHILWSEDSVCYREYFSQKTVDIIARQVMQNLIGLYPGNTPIKVADKVICHVMSNVYQDKMSKVGDIYTIFTIPDTRKVNFVQNMIDRVIEIITLHIRTEHDMIENNSKLSKWTTVLGDFNKHNLRSHSIIKVRDKNTSFRGEVSFMNY